MSRTGEITLPWGDDDYKFCLPYKQLMELQEACDAGPAVIRDRLMSGAYKVQDIRETLRQGLIGGGMEQGKALVKVKANVDAVPLQDNILIAWAVLNARIVGAPDEPILGKRKGARKKKATGSPMEKSPSENSSKPVVQ